MKKTILSLLCGMLLGIVLMSGVFSILNMKSAGENVLAQNIEVSEQRKEVKKEDISNLVTEVDMVEKETEEVENCQTIPLVAEGQIPYYIKVNRQANCVTIYTMDEEGNYTIPVKAMTCSVGLDNATPLGISKISERYVWRLLFGNTYGYYTVRFNGHILFHSVPYLSKSNDTLKEGEFNLLGQPASQGCVRLCVADAKWIYDNCEKGTVVEVYDSPDPGPLGKPVMPQIDADSPYEGWDPTDPDIENPWHDVKIDEN